MVNTFLIHLNFLESAKLLDKRRLPNQRREALQILHIIQWLKQANHDPAVLPSNPYDWYSWIRQVIRVYRSNTPSPHVPGFVYHPAVLMWLGHEDSLKEYLDAHIEITISRGIKNTMLRYDVRNAPRPPWTIDPDFISRHRMVLLRKEMERGEPPWYQLMDHFIVTQVPSLYYWPYTPSLGKAALNQGESDHSHRYMTKIGFKPN
jgi:hypothetical protein